jgi:hypothetical protein
MISRNATNFLVTLAIGSVLVADTGVAGSRGGVAPAAPAARLAGSRLLFHPTPFAQRSAIRSHAFRGSFSRRRGFAGAGIWGDGSGYDGSWYRPYTPYYDYTGQGGTQGGTYEPPTTTYPRAYPVAGYSAGGVAHPAERPIYVVPYRPGCDSESQRLPWRDGGERAITIVRC